MIKNIYICDRCKAEQEGYTQMWRIYLQIVSEDTYPRTAGSWMATTVPLWCRKCVNELQLISFPPTPVPKGEPLPVRLTLEDQIREIIAEEVQNQTQQ